MMFRFRVKATLLAGGLIAVAFVVWFSQAYFVVPLEFKLRRQQQPGITVHDYVASFIAHDYECGPLHGSVSGNFGYSELLGFDVQDTDLIDPTPIKAKLILRRRPFPWSPTDSIGHELKKHFKDVTGSKNSDGFSVFDAPIWSRL